MSFFGFGRKKADEASFDPEAEGACEVASEKSFDPDGEGAFCLFPVPVVCAYPAMLARPRPQTGPQGRRNITKTTTNITSCSRRLRAPRLILGPYTELRQHPCLADVDGVASEKSFDPDSGGGLASEKSFDPDSAGFIGDAALSEKSYDPETAGFLRCVSACDLPCLPVIASS